jgi:DNA primase large subunit
MKQESSCIYSICHIKRMLKSARSGKVKVEKVGLSSKELSDLKMRFMDQLEELSKEIRVKLHKIEPKHAIAQAVSPWLPTAAARVRARVWQVRFVVRKLSSGQDFVQVLLFPLP